jgi:hypothetical protein
MKGVVQIEALQKINEILNKIPTQKTTKTQRVTLYEATAPPQATKPIPKTTVLKSKTILHSSIQSVIIDKPIQTVTPTPRVQENMIPTRMNKLILQVCKTNKMRAYHIKRSNYILISMTQHPIEPDYHKDRTDNSINKNSENESNLYMMQRNERNSTTDNSFSVQNTQKPGQNLQQMNLEG